MSEWKEYKLGELTSVITKGTTPSTLGGGFVERGVNFIKSEAVSYNAKIDKSTFVFIDEETQYKLKRSQLKKDDILFSMAGIYLGKNGLVTEDMLPANTNQALAIIRLNQDKASPKFIHYYLRQKSVIDLVNNMSGQSAQPNINFEEIKSIDISLPPLIEQTAIASILSSLDDKIDLLQRQNKTLEQLAETLFRQRFIEEAEESWEEKKLGELLTITSSKRIFYSEYVSSGVPFYRSKEIIELRNTGSTNSELYIPNERFDEINNKFGSPKEGDILMTSVGTLGVAYRVRKTDKFYFKDGNLTWFKDFKGLPSSIVYLWLISKIGQEELAAITIGSTQEALTIEGLKSISFKIPPKESIKLYETEFNTIIDKIEFNQNQIRTLTQTRDTLLPKLMSGEVRVNN